MAGRRSRKGEAAKSRNDDPTSEKVRRPRTTLRDLPTYSQSYDERATNPVIELNGRTTHLPPPADEDIGGSLEALAQHARRSAPPPRTPVVHRLVLPLQPRSSAPPPMPQVHAQVHAQAQPSSMPVPPVANTVRPVSTIRPRAGWAGWWPGDRFRSLGTVILSASVGAVVALAMWGLRSGIDRTSQGGNFSSASLAVAPASSADERCAPSTAPAATQATTEAKAATTSTSESPETRPVTFDTLPISRNLSGNSHSSTVSSRPAPATRTATFARSMSPEPAATVETPAPAPAPRKKARAVSPRVAVTNAVQRASYAAHSCETGPQKGKVQVTFSPTGAVQSVDLIQGFGDIGVNGCVLRAFSRVRVSAFEGDPIVVRKTVSW